MSLCERVVAVFGASRVRGIGRGADDDGSSVSDYRPRMEISSEVIFHVASDCSGMGKTAPYLLHELGACSVRWCAKCSRSKNGTLYGPQQPAEGTRARKSSFLVRERLETKLCWRGAVPMPERSRSNLREAI